MIKNMKNMFKILIFRALNVALLFLADTYLFYNRKLCSTNYERLQISESFSFVRFGSASIIIILPTV